MDQIKHIYVIWVISQTASMKALKLGVWGIWLWISRTIAVLELFILFCFYNSFPQRELDDAIEYIQNDLVFSLT